MKRTFRPIRILGWLVAGAVALLIVLQFVPYGRSHTNPAITGAPAWDSQRTEALARQACFDCHSHETRWPWYASLAPVSWRIQNHVEEGRSKLDFSAFDRPQEEAGDAAEVVQEGEMPPWDYALMHPEARLTAGERQELARGLAATFGGEQYGLDGTARDEDDD